MFSWAHSPSHSEPWVVIFLAARYTFVYTPTDGHSTKIKSSFAPCYLQDLIRYLRQTSYASVYDEAMSLPCVQMITSALDVITGADGTDEGQKRFASLKNSPPLYQHSASYPNQNQGVEGEQQLFQEQAQGNGLPCSWR